MNCSEVEILAKKLINIPSVTPNDHGCQDIIKEYLLALDFEVENFDKNNVSNLWANFSRNQDPKSKILVFAGHTDVVPSGPIENWLHPPFLASRKNNLLYGRGAADMKGSLAAMLVATKMFLVKNKHSNCKFKLGFLITSDEEGIAVDGTKYVVDLLLNRNEKIDYCIVGEPSSDKILGDVIKNGRRGSLSGHLTIFGLEGHVAYPQLAINPIHASLKFLNEFTNIIWDQGNSDFPATSLQIVNLNSGAKAINVIPGELKLQFNFRYSSSSTFESLSKATEKLLLKYNLKYNLIWHDSARPFLTPNNGELIKIVSKAIKKVAKINTKLSTDGGTSDGRFIAPAFNCELLELGPRNYCIHKIDEHIDINDLENLTLIYEEILNLLFIT